MGTLLQPGDVIKILGHKSRPHWSSEGECYVVRRFVANNVYDILNLGDHDAANSGGWDASMAYWEMVGRFNVTIKDGFRNPGDVEWLFAGKFKKLDVILINGHTSGKSHWSIPGREYVVEHTARGDGIAATIWNLGMHDSSQCGGISLTGNTVRWRVVGVHKGTGVSDVFIDRNSIEYYNTAGERVAAPKHTSAAPTVSDDIVLEQGTCPCANPMCTGPHSFFHTT